MDFLKDALKQITGEIQIGNFGAVRFGGESGTSATLSGRVTSGDQPPLTRPELGIIVGVAGVILTVVLLLRR